MGLEFEAGQEVAVPQHTEQLPCPLAELVHVWSTVQVEETCGTHVTCLFCITAQRP